MHIFFHLFLRFQSQRREREKDNEKEAKRMRWKDERAKCFFSWLNDSRDQNRIKVTMRVMGWTKEAFPMNQFSISPCCFHRSACIPWRSSRGNLTIVSQVYFGFYCICSETQVDATWTNWFEWYEGWPCCIQRRLLVKRQGHILYTNPGSGIFPCQGFHPNPLLPSSHHLPWRLCCIPLPTSPPLMPFSIDHYPPLPSPLLASAQSEMPASLWSL